MRYVLGLDGGGTKTECVLLGEDGRIIVESRGGPANPNRVGFAGAAAAVRDAAGAAMRTAGVSADQVRALCAGLAGAANPDSAQKMKRLLEEEFPGIAIRICTDLDLTLKAVGEGAAIVLIAGTGSGAVGRDAHGQMARVGGYGYLLGDEGSAHHVGQRAMNAALRHFERTGLDAPLGKRILAETGEPSWAELQARVNAAPDDVFPRLFPVVVQAEASGDAAARRLLEECAAALGELVKDLVERLQLQTQKFLLARTGGMIGRSRYLDERLNEHLRKVAPFGQFAELTMHPAEAAARMAVELAVRA